MAKEEETEEDGLEIEEDEEFEAEDSGESL
jgi:hypothetical protein